MRPDGDLDAPDVSGAKASETTGAAEPWPELLSEGTARAAQAGSTAPALPDPHVA